jgi:hypothetical protein
MALVEGAFFVAEELALEQTFRNRGAVQADEGSTRVPSRSSRQPTSLREKARKALGDKFSIREFHNVVLETATVPLEVLEQQVNAYIRSKGGAI